MKKKNLKSIKWKRAETDFKCWRIAPPRSLYIPMRACRRPSCRLHHKLWVPSTIMKLSWDWKSSISNLEHKCSGFQPVRAFPSRPVFRRYLSFPPCCVKEADWLPRIPTFSLPALVARNPALESARHSFIHSLFIHTVRKIYSQDIM